MQFLSMSNILEGLPGLNRAPHQAALTSCFTWFKPAFLLSADRGQAADQVLVLDLVVVQVLIPGPRVQGQAAGQVLIPGQSLVLVPGR
ncbi:hypothetical protein EBZ80_20345 [bacterium]|nr:hypothetical protein [bacterium]